MNTKQEILEYIKELNRLLLLELPKVSSQLEVYQRKLDKGELTRNPLSSPQFNG